MKEDDKLTLIKDILLTDDREFAEKISARIKAIEHLLSSKDNLATKVNPIISERLMGYTEEIPKTLGPVITAALKTEIKNSKDQVVDALYPILGKMIKKYIAQEIKALSDKINDRLNWRKRFSSKFKNRTTQNQNLLHPKIQEVFLIEKESGLLKENYSNSETIDKEMISGMLTAIKVFVEDAFSKKGQSLELIEYELYKIHIQSFMQYYIAVVIEGDYGLSSKNRLQNLIFDFYEKFTQTSRSKNNEEISLKNYFKDVEI